MMRCSYGCTHHDITRLFLSIQLGRITMNVSVCLRSDSSATSEGQKDTVTVLIALYNSRGADRSSGYGKPLFWISHGQISSPQPNGGEQNRAMLSLSALVPNYDALPT